MAISMRVLLLIFAAVLVVNCAGHYESDRNNPTFYRADHPLTNEPVAAGILAAGTILANPSYYKSRTISGKCVQSSKVDSLAPLCPSVGLVLKDSSGKIRARALVNDGQFTFHQMSDTPYDLDVDSGNWALDGTSLRVKRGDEIFLKLKHK